MYSILKFSDELVNPSGNNNDNDHAHNRGDKDRDELCLDDVEVEHEGYTRRNEKESEIFHEEVGNAFHPTKLNPLQLQEKCQQQHADDT